MCQVRSLGSQGLGLAHRVGSRQGPDFWGSRQRKARTKLYPGGWGEEQSRPPQEEDKRHYTGALWSHPHNLATRSQWSVTCPFVQPLPHGSSSQVKPGFL